VLMCAGPRGYLPVHGECSKVSYRLPSKAGILPVTIGPTKHAFDMGACSGFCHGSNGPVTVFVLV